MAERENVIRLKMSVSNGEIPMRIKGEVIPLKYYGSSNGEIITEVNNVGRKIESRLSEAIKNKINKVDDCVSGNLSAEYPQATEFSLGGAKLYIENNGEKQYVTAQQLKELLQDSPVARRIILGGDATGETSFDGSADVTIPVTITNNSHSHAIENVEGLQVVLNSKEQSGASATALQNAKAYTDEKIADLGALASKDSLTIDNVEGLQGALNSKEASGSSATALQNAKAYTDGKIANLINSAPTTLDTLGEIATAMQNNKDVVDALEQAIGSKANNSHSHTIENVEGLQDALNSKEQSGASATALQNAKAYTDEKIAVLGALASKDSLSKGEVGLGNVSNDAQVKRTEMGVASGVATLGADGKVPASQLPSTTVTTDSELSSTSTNPVQNKVVHAALEKKANADGVVTSVSMRASSTPLKFYYSVNGGAEQQVILNSPSIPTYGEATQGTSGLMSAADKTKLDGLTMPSFSYSNGRLVITRG